MKPIQSAGEAVPTCSDLEDPIEDALRMASIAVDLVERAICGQPHQKLGSGGLYAIGADQREDIAFAVIQTERFIDIIKATWEKVQ